MSTSSSASVRWIGSPHHRKGRAGYRPEAIVIHVMEGTLRGTDAWFNDPKSKVSAHYGIGKTGEVHQYVAETDAAYHAGRIHKPTWRGIREGVNPNLYTLGIEHEGFADDIWPEPMLYASAALIRELCERWSIPIDREHVIGHRELYTLKTCPGFRVDLDHLVELATMEPKSYVPVLSNLVNHTETVITISKLNVRELPTTESKCMYVLPNKSHATTNAWTAYGQSVRNNPHWYRLEDGYYAWAGGTNLPTPSLQNNTIQT